MALLNTKDVRHRSHGFPKFMPGWKVPYKVLEKVGKVACCLALPVELKMHPVFHVSAETCEEGSAAATASSSCASQWRCSFHCGQNT